MGDYWVKCYCYKIYHSFLLHLRKKSKFKLQLNLYFADRNDVIGCASFFYNMVYVWLYVPSGYFNILQIVNPLKLSHADIQSTMNIQMDIFCFFILLSWRSSFHMRRFTQLFTATFKTKTKPYMGTFKAISWSLISSASYIRVYVLPFKYLFKRFSFTAVLDYAPCQRKSSLTRHAARRRSDRCRQTNPWHKDEFVS